jgi:hypothetical protein
MDGTQHVKSDEAELADLVTWLWEQEAASSNLAIPTRSGYMPSLVKIVCGAAMGAKCHRIDT